MAYSVGSSDWGSGSSSGSSAAVMANDRLPPVDTATGTDRAGATGDAMGAVNVVSLTKVVVRASPSKLTTEPAVNPVPVTVIVNSGAPTAAVAGAIPETVEATGVHNDGGYDVS